MTRMPLTCPILAVPGQSLLVNTHEASVEFLSKHNG